MTNTFSDGYLQALRDIEHYCKAYVETAEPRKPGLLQPPTHNGADITAFRGFHAWVLRQIDNHEWVDKEQGRIDAERDAS
jgi:hypothetical protein